MSKRKVRVGEAALLRLLRTVAEVKAAKGRWPYTRELLEHLRTWGYGQEVLEEAVRRGLVERFEGGVRLAAALHLQQADGEGRGAP